MTTTDESRYMEELMEKVGEGDSEAMYDLALSYLPTAFDVKDPGSYTKGLSLLQQAVNGNNTEAMFKLAEAYLAPRYGLTQDYTKAMSLLQQAIAGNNTKAMVKLAGFYLGTTYLPETVPCKGPAEGVLLLEQAIARNNTEAMLILAEGYLEPKYGLTQDHNKAMVKLADAYLGPAYGLPQDDRKAMSLLQLAVERGSAGASFMVDLIRKVDSGDTNAMCVLARCFLDRRCGGLPNSPKGISLLQRAVVGHNTNAMVELSRCYLEPKNGFTQITTQITEGISLLKQASEGGNHEAMSDLACMYMKGENGLPIHLRKAMHLFQAANDDCGLCNIGDAYKRNHDMERAVRAWTLAADRKNEPAMCSLGWCYQHGVGVERDQRKAVSLYKAPEWVRPVSLGVCYLLGEGVRRNWTKAVSLFQRSNTGKSAFNDGKPACNDGTPYLGWCYLWGCGVDRDVGEALGILNSASKDYCRAAAFLGYFYERGVGDLKKARVLYDDISDYGAEALGELGVFCQRGDCGAPMDKELAVKYFKMAAEGGDIISMFHLGVCLRDGDGVERDMDQSRRWLEEAALCGHRGAAKILHPEEMQQQGRVLHHRTVQLENHCHEVEATLAQERISVANLNKSLKAEVDRSTSFQDIINTMTSLITATAPDFRVEKLLGTGSHAAAFKVQYLTAFDNNSIRSSALTTSSTTTKRGRDMVMKVLFNWENTPQQTMLRQKYMAECVTLSLVPNHPNIIHPLGAISPV
ncbi:protein kinase [Pelomyxa schiedti]|nr:protein kinase [Pelomyxa schiedti]